MRHDCFVFSDAHANERNSLLFQQHSHRYSIIIALNENRVLRLIKRNGFPSRDSLLDWYKSWFTFLVAIEQVVVNDNKIGVSIYFIVRCFLVTFCFVI